MSHSRNVEAFEKLLGICTGYGEQYKPGQPNLRVENLSAIINRARTALSNVNAAKTNWEDATNNREVAFKETNELVSRILAELRSSGVLPQTVDDALAMVRKIKGYSARRVPGVVAKADQSVMPPATMAKRARGLDHASVIDHFEKLLQTISVAPEYQPTADELKVQTLQDKLAVLRQKNTSVIEADAELGKARRERNIVLYKGRGSLHSTAMAVKQQTKALFGNRSEAATAASHVHFRKSKIK